MPRGMMLGSLLALCLIAVPGHTAPGNSTARWETKMETALGQQFCGTPGHMVKMFKISQKACMKTYEFALKQCLTAVNQVSYYRVFDPATGMVWGKILGMCIGHAYDHKYSYKTPIP